MNYSISMSRSPRHRRPLIEALEPRLLFSATADIAVFDDGASDGQYLAQAAAQTDLVSIYMPSDPVMLESQALDGDPQADLSPSENSAVTTLVFVDTAVDDYEILVDDIRARIDANSVAIVYLDSSKEGLDQISDYLAGASGISAIHIISHGVAGNLQLGTQVLNEHNINQFKAQLSGWQSTLDEGADILLYGCDLAANESGINFLRQLSELTGADIAASNDLTGNSHAQADWVLEERIGIVEAESLFAANEPMVWQGALADIVHLNSGAPTNEEAIPTGGKIMQGVQLTSSQTVDRVQITLADHGTASTSVIMSIRQSTYDGVIVATASVNTASLGGTLGTVNFDFSAITFNAYTVYWVEFRTNDGADNLVGIGYINSNVIASEFVVNNSGDPLRDMAIALIDVQNRAPTVDIAVPDQSTTEASLFSFTFDEYTFSDLDGDTLNYTASLANGNPLPAWLNFDAVTRTFSGVPDDGDVGATNVRVTASDGNGLSAYDDFTLTVINLPEAPFVVNPIPDQTASGFTQFTYQFPAYNQASPVFADPDVGGSVVSYRATLADDSALPGWLNFDSATRTFTGVPTNADAGTITIKLYGTDNTGLESVTPDQFNIVISQTANDAPVNSVPGAQSTNEDTALVFNQANGNRLQIADADALSSSVQVTLSVSNGILTLGGTTGLSFTTGDGSNDAIMVFTGTVTSINNALATLIYTPTSNYTGADTLTITTNDLGNSGTGGALSDSDTVAITVNPVNDAPTVSIVPTTYNALEQVAINLHGTGISVADVDGGALTITLDAQWSNSNLAATVGTTGVVVVSGFNTQTLVLSGTAAQLNDLFAGNNGGTLTYRLSGNTPVATDVVTVTASDGSLSGNDTFTVNITAVNDAPVNTVPGAQATNEDTALVFSAGNLNQIQVSDVDLGAGDLEITLSVTNGSLTLAGVVGLVFTTGDGTGDDTMVFRGTQASVNTALATLTFNPTLGFSGASVLSITTSDLGNTGTGGVLTDTDNVNITVNAVNDAPTIANPIPNQNATEDAAFNFQFAANTFNDVDVGDTLTYSAQLAGGGALPAWLSFDAVTRTFSGTPLNAHVGTASIDVIANDGNGGTVTDTFDIVVANTNDAPTVANAVPNQAATEDAAFNFQFALNTFADVDVGDTLTYSAQLGGGGALPAWLSFDPVTRTFSGTPLNAHVGTVSIDVIANDGNGGTVTDTFDIVVANTNDAPTVANAIPNQAATEDAAFNFQFALNTFADVDVGDTLTYSAQLAGGGALPAWLSFDPVTRTFSGTPLNAHVGTVSIDVIANDGNGGTVTDTFDIVVANANDAPTVANPIPNQAATEDAAFNFQFAANVFADSDVGDTLTYAAQLAGGGAIPAWLSFDPVTRTFSGTPLNAHVGTVSIDVIANDGNGGTVTDTFNIVVANTNDAPTIANAIPNQGATQNAAFNFQFALNTFADVDVGDTLTYSAQLAGGGALPAWLSFDPVTRTFSGTPANGDIGTVSIDVIANDGNGGTVTDTFDIVVSDVNDPPTVANPIPNQAATEDAAFNFQFALNTFADVDVGDTLTYSAQSAGGGALPAWLSFDPVTRTFSGTPLNAHVGTVSIDVIANDGNGGTVTDTFDIVVANTNDAPTVANPIPNQSATENSAFNFTFAVNTFTDQDVGDVLTYTAQLAGGGALPAWLSFNAATRTFSGVPTNTDIGTLTLEVIASDGNGGSVADSFNLVVSAEPVNLPPVVQAGVGDQVVAEDSGFSFTITASAFSDPEGDALTYAAQLVGGGALPSWLTFDAATRTFSGTPLNDDVGVIDVEVTASDGTGSASDSFTITVTNTNDAPVASPDIYDVSAQEDSPFTLSLPDTTFSDEDVEDVLSFSARLANGDALPSWLSFNAETLTLSGTPGGADVGMLAIQVIASDGQASAFASVNLTILAVDDVPVTSGLAPINNLEDAPGDMVDLFTAFSDEETPSNQLLYSVVSNNNPSLVSSAVIDPVTGQLQLGYGANQFGSADLIIRAQDPQGASVETLLQVNIESVNDVPTTTGIAEVNVDAGAAPQQMNLRTAFNDVEDGVQLSYSVTGNSNPAIVPNVQINPATGVMVVSFSSSAGGESVITLRALDRDGAWVDTQLKVTVTPLDLGVGQPVSPQEPGKVPPTLPPTTPPTEPPVVEVPSMPPTGGGEVPPTLNPGGETDTLTPGTGGAGSPGVITGEDERTDIGYVNDKSSRDYARAEERLGADNVPLTVLTASTSLVSLIAPDAGFAPWEAADFDNEVRRIRAQMDEAMEEEQDRKAVVAGLTFSVTTGLLVWSLRASSLLLTMMSMLPLWRGLDPLPILDEVNKKKKELEQQRKDREREDKSAKEVGYLFDHAQKKGSRR